MHGMGFGELVLVLVVVAFVSGVIALPRLSPLSREPTPLRLVARRWSWSERLLVIAPVLLAGVAAMLAARASR